MNDRVILHLVEGAYGAVLGRLGLGVLMTAGLFLSGCGGARLLLLRADPSLQLNQLQREGVAILPAVASTPLMDARELAPVRQQLASHLAKLRPTIAIADEARVDAALRDRPQLARVLQRFARTLSVDHEELGEICEATGARYAVFVVFDEYSFNWRDLPAPQYQSAPEDVTVSAADRGDEAIEPASPGRVLPGALGFGGVHVHIQTHGRVGLGIRWVPGAGMSGGAPLESSNANARLVGTLSIVDAVEGKAVWVGAAMVNQSVKAAYVEGRRRVAIPPEPAKLTPTFFDALVGRWPS